MKTKIDLLKSWAISCFLICLMASCSQILNEPAHRNLRKVDFRNGQHVLVTMKNGDEVPAVVLSSKRNKIYFVREYGKPHHRGKVPVKYLRAMEESEKNEFGNKGGS